MLPSNIRFAALSSALMALAAGTAHSFSGALQAAQMRLSQPKAVVESATKQLTANGYTKARTGRAQARRKAAKRRNVLRNRRAHR